MSDNHKLWEYRLKELRQSHSRYAFMQGTAHWYMDELGGVYGSRKLLDDTHLYLGVTKEGWVHHVHNI